ncbi:MAG: 50S ribosomal protein L24 [Nanoarchaeota archaeon]
MPKCIFCGKEYGFHEGVTLVKNDGTINYICSSKCRKNLLMKRRKVRWVHKTAEDKISKKK